MPFLRWGRDRFTRARNANTPGHSIVRPPHGQQHDDFTGIFPGPPERRSPARSRLVKSDIPEEVDRDRIFTIQEKKSPNSGEAGLAVRGAQTFDRPP